MNLIKKYVFISITCLILLFLWNMVGITQEILLERTITHIEKTYDEVVMKCGSVDYSPGYLEVFLRGDANTYLATAGVESYLSLTPLFLVMQEGTHIRATKLDESNFNIKPQIQWGDCE